MNIWSQAMAEREIARKINIAWAINTKKDFCKVGKHIIPFDIICDLSKATSYSKNTTANSKAVLAVDHVIPGMVGNAGSGIESGISGLAGTVVLTNGSPTVTVNDKPAVRHGDDCKMNCNAAGKSNVPGKIYTSAPLARLSSQAHNIENPVLRNLALANLQLEQWKQQASDELVRGTKHFFKSTKDSLVTLSDATGITGTSAESQAARARMMAGVEAIGALMGPPAEMVQGAYMSGNAEYIAQIEQMQRNQQAAWGQVGNSIATAWTDANARSGPVGAATMVFTAIGWNVAAGAATGAGVGMAARIAVNVGGKVLNVSAGVGRTIAEVLATAKTPAQAAKGLEEAAAAAKAAGASVDDVAALTAAKEAALKGPQAPAKPAGTSPEKGAVVTTRPSKLTPAQQAIFDEQYKKAPAAKKQIDKLSKEIADENGGKVAEAPIKSADRAAEKIASDYDGDATKIKDLARNTIVVPEENIGRVTNALENKGADIKVVDAATDTMGYSGVKTTVATEAGLTAEIQVNSPAMIYAKESATNARAILGDDVYNSISRQAGMPGGRGHDLYEQWRAIADKTSPQAQQLAAESRQYYDLIRRNTGGN